MGAMAGGPPALPPHTIGHDKAQATRLPLMESQQDNPSSGFMVENIDFIVSAAVNHTHLPHDTKFLDVLKNLSFY